MSDWFTTLDVFSKFYWFTALIGSTIFLIVLIMSFFGGDTDAIGDVDGDMDADLGADFQFFSFKSLVGFFTIFGWSGIACIEAGWGRFPTIITSIIAGLIMAVLIATLFYFVYKLSASGTLNYKNAINCVGEVYLTIGNKRSSMGKVMVNVQGTVRELDAITNDTSDLKSGTVIKVIEVTNNGILVVTNTNTINSENNPLAS